MHRKLLSIPKSNWVFEKKDIVTTNMMTKKE